MGAPVGNLGGLAVVAETLWNTTPTTPTWEWMFGVSSTAWLRRNFIKSQWLTMAPASNRPYSKKWVDGELTCLWSEEIDIMGVLLSSAAVLSTLTYPNMAAGTAPTNDVGLSVLANYGTDEWIGTGCRPTSLGWQFSSDAPTLLTFGLMGGGWTKSVTPETVAAPSEDYIHMPTDITTITLNSVAVGIKSGSITLDLPKSGADRQGIGTEVIRQPVAVGQKNVKFSFTIELNDDTGSDSLAILDDWITAAKDDDAGDLVIDGITVNDCKIEGDGPALGQGIPDVTFSGEGTGLTVVQVDNIT